MANKKKDNLERGVFMSVLPYPSRRARTHWLEPVAALFGALVLSWGTSLHSSMEPPQTTSPSPSPTQSAKPWTANTQNRMIDVKLAQVTIKVPLKAPKKPPAVHLYHIEWGDTLWGLSERFHVSVASLKALNHLTSSTIVAGSTLIIPESYTVQPGDTLKSIAKHHNVPLVLLWHHNRLQHDVLKAGQTLSIPNWHSSAYSAPSVQSSSEASSQPVNPYSSSDLSANDLVMLAHLVYAEAGDQPFLGQVAVAAVVLNRMKTPGFPHSVQAVIFAPGQFETVSNGTFWQAPSAQAMLAAKAAAEGWDPSHGALYFYNPTLVSNSWMNSLPVTAQIGSQVFCR